MALDGEEVARLYQRGILELYQKGKSRRRSDGVISKKKRW